MVTYPEDWKKYPFEKIFGMISNNTFSRDKLSEHGNVGNIHYGDVLVKYGCILTDDDSIPRIKPDVQYDANNFLAKNDIVIADTAEDETVGKVVQIGNVSLPLLGGLHTVVCRPKFETAEGYLGYYMNSRYWHDQILPYITGIKVSSVSKKSLKETYLVLPAIKKEQEAVVNVLKEMDGYIQNLYELIEKKKGIRDGALEDLMSGRTRLNGFEGEWGYSKLKTLYKRLKGTPITAGQMQEIKSATGDVRVFAGGATEARIRECDLKNASIINVPVVIVQSRGVIDFVYCEDKCTFKNEMWGYTADDVNAVRFLYYYLRHNVDYFRNAGSGRSSFSQISLSVTEDYEIPDITIEEQKAIVEILSAMDQEIADLEAERDKMIQIREGAMDDLLTGRVRLTM